ncbi:MAG: nitrous oxide-stimulated promoter family protein [Planctomycetota bacterium]
MPRVHPRVEREKRTMAVMVRVYCRAHHGSRGPLCAECQELLYYAVCRLDRCPFGEDKPTCAKCPIHCYRPEMRDRARAVMRYSGPRMLWRHPVLAIRHALEGRRPAPDRPKRPKIGGPTPKPVAPLTPLHERNNRSE